MESVQFGAEERTRNYEWYCVYWMMNGRPRFSTMSPFKQVFKPKNVRLSLSDMSLLASVFVGHPCNIGNTRKPLGF